MKLLITSDVHGHLERLKMVMKKHPDIDYHINAGDMCLPLKSFDQDVISVKGNNDFFLELPYQRTLDFKELRILLTHGHLERVKMTMTLLKQKALQANVHLCVFGHTHQRYLNRFGNIIFVNPGALGDYNQSYAIYENGQVTFYELTT
jgi:uncharacterized protein